MDISLLKTFLEVARTRHFGKAADALFVTQSAVSARIKLLESNLSVDLFSRRRNDIQLTPAGMRLILVSARDGYSVKEAMGRDYYMVDWGSVFTLSHAEYFPDIPPPAARLASGTLARDLILVSGGSAYLAEQMVHKDLEQGVLFSVADAPVIRTYRLCGLSAGRREA